MTTITDTHRAIARLIWDAGHDHIRGKAMDASWVAQQVHIEVLSEYIAEHDRRVTELLAANNREVENRRMLAAVLRKITRDRNARVHLSDTLFGQIEDALERIAR